MLVFWCYIWAHIFSHVHTHRLIIDHLCASSIKCRGFKWFQPAVVVFLFLFFKLNELLITWKGNINPTFTSTSQICLWNLWEAVTENWIWQISRWAVIMISWSTSANSREAKLTAFAEERPSIFPHSSAWVCTNLLWHHRLAGITQHQGPPTAACVMFVPAILDRCESIMTQWAKTGEAAADFRKLCSHLNFWKGSKIGLTLTEV